jgi:hypothetical protein
MFTDGCDTASMQASAWGRAVASDAARFDLTLDRARASDLVTSHGWDALLIELQRLAGGPGLDLYSVSTDWQRRRYITTLKARGARGDLLVKLV